MKLTQRLGDRGLLILLMALLAAIVVIERIVVTQLTPDPPLSSWSDEEEGASAMYGWLDELGYDMVERRLPTFEIPEDVGLVFLLEPTMAVTDREFRVLRNWVDQGGMLIVSGKRAYANTVYQRFGYGFTQPNQAEAAEDVFYTLQPESPFWHVPDLTGELSIDATLETFDLRPEFDQVVHASVAGQPFVVSHPVGDGHVVLVPETSVFSNQGLSGEANRKLLINLIAQQGAGHKIWFDEWHHGERAIDFSNGEISGPFDWLRYTITGRAVLLTCVVLFIFMLLQGRHLGRPQPLPETLKRRGAAEYVDALATLTRQAGDTEVVREHASARFRRNLITRYRLDPAIDDASLIERLGRMKSAEVAQDAAEILRQLNRPDQTETELIDLQQKIDKFTEENL